MFPTLGRGITGNHSCPPKGVGGQGGPDGTADAPVQEGALDGQAEGGAGKAVGSRALELQPDSASQSLPQHDTTKERPAQSAPKQPAPLPPPAGDVGRLLPADSRSDDLDDWSIIKYVAGRAIWTVAGFAAGWLVAAQITNALDTMDEEEAFIAAVLSLNLPYP